MANMAGASMVPALPSSASQGTIPENMMWPICTPQQYISFLTCQGKIC